MTVWLNHIIIIIIIIIIISVKNPLKYCILCCSTVRVQFARYAVYKNKLQRNLEKGEKTSRGALNKTASPLTYITVRT